MAEQHRRNLSVVAETLDQQYCSDTADVEGCIDEARRALSSISNDRIALKVATRHIARETKENARHNSKTTSRLSGTSSANSPTKCAERIPLPIYQPKGEVKALKGADTSRGKKSAPPPSVRQVSSRSMVVPSMRSGAAATAADLLLRLDAHNKENTTSRRGRRKKRSSSKTRGSSVDRQVAGLRREMHELLQAFRMNQERNDAAIGAEIEKQWFDVQSRVMELVQSLAEQQRRRGDERAASNEELTALVRQEVHIN